MIDLSHLDDDQNYVSLAEEVKALQWGCALCNPAWLKAIRDSGRFAPPAFFCLECCKKPAVAAAIKESERKSSELAEMVRKHYELACLEMLSKAYGAQPPVGSGEIEEERGE